MKNKCILLLGFFFAFFSCKKVSTDGFELNDNQLISQNDVIGVVKYTDEVYGDIYLQFQNDGVCKELSYYEGTNIWEGSWTIENDVITIVGDNVWISAIKISELNGTQIKFSIGTNPDIIIGNFLTDDNGNKINSYSGFDSSSAPNTPNSNSNEACNTCGKNLITPTSRNCTWCNNIFDGWSPNEHDCSMLIECSAKQDEEYKSQESLISLISFDIHNGCTWDVNQQHFCSLKCMNEFKYNNN